MIEIEFELNGQTFRLVGQPGTKPRLFDAVGALWSDEFLVAWAGERAAHLALAYAHRDWNRRAAFAHAH